MGRREWRYFEKNGGQQARDTTMCSCGIRGAAVSDCPAHKSGEEEEEESVSEDLAEPKADESDSSRSQYETPVVEVKTQVKRKKRKKSNDKTDKMEAMVQKAMEMQSESE